MKKTVKKIMVTTLAIGTLITGFSYVNGAQASEQTHTMQVSEKQNHKQLLLQTKKLADQGRVITSKDLGIGSSRRAIEAKWGKPDKNSKKFDLKYSKHSTNFYFSVDDEKQKSAFNVETSDKRYSAVTYDEVKKTFGKANEEWFEQNDEGEFEYYVSYVVAGKKHYDLQFCFYSDKNGKKGKFKHVAVNDPGYIAP
ncbi:DUF4309 domain-containing protein [Shimazuella kribbensis]|uniref:DUF4309 domain-containing protein n=1 Tax=Shimazuella kribbensis TaxID=139808 RepID=UPI00040EB797|nr:DUF4309 domain-containing protein [Shimazuella kribbensis]